MAFATLHFRSEILGKAMAMNVLTPDGPGPWPVFYLLHGLSDDYSVWHRHTRIELYAKKFPFLIVMPDGLRGWYTNHTSGPRYADYVVKEVVGLVELTFRVRTDRAGRCVGGLSMGGYGAMRLGLGSPDLFASVTSHSGAVMHGSVTPDRVTTSMNRKEIVDIFGDDPRGTDHDLMHLAKKADAAGNLPRMRIDCGTEDYLLDANRIVHRFLDDEQIPHEYEEFPGSHDWPYWDAHINEALAFHARGLA